MLLEVNHESGKNNEIQLESNKCSTPKTKILFCFVTQPRLGSLSEIEILNFTDFHEFSTLKTVIGQQAKIIFQAQ